MPRDGSYLYKRKGSANWYLRIQFPSWMTQQARLSYFSENIREVTTIRRKYEKSLNTSDKDEARIIANDMILHHEMLLLFYKQSKRVNNAVEIGPKRFASDGPVKLSNGDLAIVEGTVVKVYDSDLKFVRQETNGPTYRALWKPNPNEIRKIAEIKARMPSKSNPDDNLVNEWIKARRVSKHIASDALNTWNAFKEHVSNKSLSKCTRDDARRFSDVLSQKSITSHTVAKKIGVLRAIVNFGIDDGLLNFNPFARAFVPGPDVIDRHSLSESDMETVRNNLHKISDSDKLLWVFLATTGMRLSEPFQITAEDANADIRHVIIGTKTKTSKRRVPLPTALIPYLPKPITKPLFAGNSADAGKRLGYFIKKIGIGYDPVTGTGDKRKVLHSLRHRAKDRLREAHCPIEVQYEILGHEKLTAASRYGQGSPLRILLKHIDEIGY